MFSSQHKDGRGGVVTLLSPCLYSIIILHGFDPMHKIIWIFLSINNHSFGIANVYASNDVVERSQLWCWMANNLPPATWLCTVILILLSWHLKKMTFFLFVG